MNTVIIIIIAILIASFVFLKGFASRLGGIGNLGQWVKNLFIASDIDPHNNNVRAIALNVETLAIWASVITSAVSIGTITYKVVENRLHMPILSLIASVIVIVAASYISDYGFRQFSTKFIFELLSFPQGWWLKVYNGSQSAWSATMQLFYRVLSWVMVGGIACLMFGLSWATSWMGAQDAYAMKDTPVSLVNVDSMRTNQVVSLQSTSNTIDKDIERLNKTLSMEKKAAQEKAEFMYGKLVASGNAWAKMQSDKMVDKAIKSTQLKIDALQATKLSMLANASTTNQEILQQNMLLNKQTITAKAEKEENFIYLFRWFGVGSSILQVLCRAFLVIMFLASGPTDENGDGKIDNDDVDFFAGGGGGGAPRGKTTTTPVSFVSQQPQSENTTDTGGKNTDIDTEMHTHTDTKGGREIQMEVSHKFSTGTTTSSTTAPKSTTRVVYMTEVVNFDHKARYNLLKQRWERSFTSASVKAKFANRVKALADILEFSSAGYAVTLEGESIKIAGVNERINGEAAISAAIQGQINDPRYSEHIQAELMARNKQEGQQQYA